MPFGLQGIPHPSAIIPQQTFNQGINPLACSQLGIQ